MPDRRHRAPVRATLTVLIALLLATVVAACGSSGPSEATQVQQDYTDFLHGVASGNGSEACGAFSPATQQRLVAAEDVPGIHSCARIIQEGAKQETAAERREVESVSVKVLSITGDKVKVRISLGSRSHTGSVEVTRYHGRWVIAGVIPTL